MKKLLSLLLSLALLGLTLTVPAYAVDGQGTNLDWEPLPGNEKTQITFNDSEGTYSAVQDATQLESDEPMCIKTTQAYYPRENAIQFSAPTPSQASSWYTFGIAGENGEIGSFYSGNNRVNLIMHCEAEKTPWLYTFNDKKTADFGSHNYDAYTGINTFGLTQRGEHWYFTINNDVLNQAVDPLLDEILNSNQKVYFIIGANLDYSFSDINIVPKADIPLWKKVDGDGEPAIVETVPGVYSAELSDTNRYARIRTTEAYNPREKEIKFKASANPTGWYTVGVAGAKADIGEFGSENNRADVIMSSPWFYTFKNDGTHPAEYGGHTYDFTKSHTFGFAQKGDNWFFTVDGKILNDQAVDANLNNLLNSNDKVYFIIGANNDYKFTDIKIVDSCLWRVKEGAGSVSTENGLTELYYNGAPTKYETVSTYDVREKEITFEYPSNTSQWLFVGVNNGTVTRGFCLVPGNESILHIAYGSDGDWVNIAAMEARTFNAGEKHSFGVREKDGRYYPAVDGKIVTGDMNNTEVATALNLFYDFVASNVGYLHFEIYYSWTENFTIKNVEIINSNALWQTSDGTGLAVSVDDNGVYTANSDKCVTTVQKYDLTKYDVSFKYTTTSGYLSLFISENGGLDYSKMEGSADIGSTNHIEFAAAYDGSWVTIPNPNYSGNENQNGDYGTGLIDFSVPHSYGVRKLGGHWYWAVDGKVLNTQTISQRLDDFMTQKGTTEFYISVGTNFSTAENTRYTAEDLKIVKQAELGDANNDGTVDILDFVRAKKYSAGAPHILVCAAADLDGNGTVNAADLIEFKRKLFDM